MYGGGGGGGGACGLLCFFVLVAGGVEMNRLMPTSLSLSLIFDVHVLDGSYMPVLEG